MEQVLQEATTAISIAILMYFLARSARKNIDKNSIGKVELKMSRIYGIAGVISIFIGLVYVAVPFFAGKVLDDKFLFLQVLVIGLFWCAGIPCFLYFRNHKVIYDDWQIEVHDVFGKTRTISWNKIIKLKFNKLFGLLIIESSSDKLKVHHHLAGFRQLMDKLEEKTGHKINLPH